jgi:hypothetical protein
MTSELLARDAGTLAGGIVQRDLGRRGNVSLFCEDGCDEKASLSVNQRCLFPRGRTVVVLSSCQLEAHSGYPAEVISTANC